MKMETLEKIEKVKKVINVCDSLSSCTDCPFSNDENDEECGKKIHQLILEIFEEIMSEANEKPDLYKRHYDTLAKYVEDRRDRLEKRSKRACDDMDVSRKYLNAISKIPQKDWTMLDTWRVGFQEGRSMVNKEWLEWVEDNFNE
jgi:hypothetical protein